MGFSRLSSFFLSVSLFFSLLLCPINASKKSYVVYMGAHSHDASSNLVDYEKVTDSHYDFLGSFLGSKEKAKDAIFYSYTRSINGFAANLEDVEAQQISRHPNVISVFLNKRKKLHTTRSWGFLGLERDGRVPEDSLMAKAKYGLGVIIANIDTGVWPESQSFNDTGLGPAPPRWKGTCETNTSAPVKCNRKLIGARMFYKGYESMFGPIDPPLLTVRDNDGHGTHTLATAGGRFVAANIYGHGSGAAKGGSPNAWLAAYKVCWAQGCYDSDILAAIDTAIADGVDVISISIGGEAMGYFMDSVAIGSFHAVRSGITVIGSGGNEGPTAASVTNVAPWIITVAASTIDREFESPLKLGNQKIYMGASLSQKSLPQTFYPLINGADAYAANSSASSAQVCLAGSLDPNKVKGKIVFCLVGGDNLGVEKGVAVLQAGGVGMILGNDPLSATNDLIAESHVLPATQITAVDADVVLSYINSTKSPVGYIKPVFTHSFTTPAPVMASFSSQGPNFVTREIFKPDITAPGVNILAAYSEAVSPTGLPSDNRRVPFNVNSGTSVACPHVAGIVGLLKALYPNWSPAAIRSAIMTSARTRDNKDEPMLNSSLTEATPFNYGAGHVRPNRAMDPGLVYDLTADDYMNFLCSLDYTPDQLSLFSNQSYSCPTNLSLFDFNYPSFSVPSLTAPITFNRRVKNVGSPGTYTVKYRAPPCVSMTVQPANLTFKATGEEQTYSVALSPDDCLYDTPATGRLKWSDGVHNVRSLIAVNVDTVIDYSVDGGL
ncbi:hypothetical protein AAC387_Pa07g1533 [Persea americana]